MVAYTTPKERRDAIASGAQSFVILPPRKPGKPRHALVGEDITLRPGGVTLATPRCIARLTLHIDREGLRRVIGADDVGAPEAVPIVFQCLNAENGAPNAEREATAIANTLGYSAWRDLWRDQRDRDGAQGIGRPNILHVELIAWEPLNLTEAKAA